MLTKNGNENGILLGRKEVFNILYSLKDGDKFRIKKYYDTDERRYFWSLQTIDGKPTSCISFNEELANKIMSLLNAESELVQ